MAQITQGVTYKQLKRVYTEINFAAFAMLGRRFRPRIRGIGKQRLYRLDAKRDYGPLAGLVGLADRTIDPQVIAEQWDRMGQFNASLESGHTTASVALKRLASCTAKNRFYRANRDLGRIFKTEFLLSYLSEPPLRSRIRKGVAEGRTTARAGPGRVLRPPRADQRSRAARADELV